MYLFLYLVYVCIHVQISSVQLLSRVRLFATSRIAARQASLSITNFWSSLRSTSIESVMPSSHPILCHSLHLLPPIPPSIRVFSNESGLRMRWPKYWSFSFSIIPSKEIPGLISFRMDWLDRQRCIYICVCIIQRENNERQIYLWVIFSYVIRFLTFNIFSKLSIISKCDFMIPLIFERANHFSVNPYIHFFIYDIFLNVIFKTLTLDHL